MYSYMLHEGHNAHIRELDGMGELIDMAENVRQGGAFHPYGNASLLEDYDFTGTHSMDEAIDFAKYGWPEGRDLVTAELDKIDVAELAGHSVLPEPQFDLAGDDPDVGRYLSGEPASMIRYDFPYTPQGKVVDVVVNCAQGASLPKDLIVQRGAALIAAVEKLHTSGYAVGVTMATSFASPYQDRCLEHYVPIVRAGEQLDVDALSFALANASFFRRFIFAAMEHESPAMRDNMEIYGRGIYGFPQNLLHIPKIEYPRVVIEARTALQGGAVAAQEIVTLVVDAATSGEKP